MSWVEDVGKALRVGRGLLRFPTHARYDCAWMGHPEICGWATRHPEICGWPPATRLTPPLPRPALLVVGSVLALFYSFVVVTREVLEPE